MLTTHKVRLKHKKVLYSTVIDLKIVEPVISHFGSAAESGPESRYQRAEMT